MKNILFANVIDTIYDFYPKKIPFSDIKYLESKQHQKLLAYRKNALLDLDFKQFIENELRNIFKSYAMEDFVDLDNDTSYRYHILMHKNYPYLDNDKLLMDSLNGSKYELIFILSYLGKYCYYYILETKFDQFSNQWYFKNKFKDRNFINIENKFLKLINIKKLNQFLIKNNYYFITDELIIFHIPDIETELCSFGNVKVYDAIFSDLISL